MEKSNLNDFDLIEKVFGYRPLDCARRENGDLVVIHPSGKKYVLDDNQIKAIISYKKELEASEKPRSHHKKPAQAPVAEPAEAPDAEPVEAAEAPDTEPVEAEDADS